MIMNEKSKERPPAGKNPLEWTVFGLSAILVVGVMVVLGKEALRWKDTPPRLHAELGTAEFQDGSWWVPVKVRNEGEGVAADVAIEVSAGDETASFTLDFVPRGTERHGRVSFPEATDLRAARVSVTGYQEP